MPTSLLPGLEAMTPWNLLFLCVWTGQDFPAAFRYRVFDSWQLDGGYDRGAGESNSIRVDLKIELLVSQPVFLSWNPFYATLRTFLRCPSHRTHVLSQGDAARAMTFH